jgi:hypothetical protein
MPSWTTVYRATVMIATGVALVWGWQFYGPSKEQVKAFAAAALEKAQTAWNDGGEPTAAAPPSAAVDPRSLAPPVVAETPAADPMPLASAPQLVPMNDGGPMAATTSADGAPLTQAPPSPAAAVDEDIVAKLLSQLEALGAANAQVMPWGSRGGLYRCCCRAKLAESSPAARHFEAVADEPAAAVKQVVANVEAWRMEQQNLLR